MSNEKQTAVGYLVEQLFPKSLSEEQYYHIEQAKAIEKQQIVEALEKLLNLEKEFDFYGENYPAIAEAREALKSAKL